MSKAVGIDLGTTNSVIAVVEGGESVVIANTEGARTTPSVVGFTKSGERLVGATAKRQSVVNPENTVSSIKRKMGTGEKTKINNQEYTPEQISSMILQKLKSDAEKYLGEKIDKAVITVPAYFNDAQRTATKNAGEIIGLEVLRIINEPTAASLAYGLDKKGTETILVWDLGGGTFDVSVLEVGEGVFEVLSTSGDTQLGGDDWDKVLTDYIVSEFKKDQGIDLKQDKQAYQRVMEAAEKAKIELSNVVQTNVNLPFVTADTNGPKHLDVNITRAKFEELTNNLLERCVEPFKKAVKDADIKIDNINEVILVGGSTRMPQVYDLIKKLTNGKEPNRSVNPDEVVALGAALQAGVLCGEVQDLVLLDVVPLSLGVETLGGVTTRLIERNTTIPVSKSEIFTTASDGQDTVTINVLQGEREMAKFNHTLGMFHLSGIPPSPRGVPQIEVTFDIDANGIVHASAKDKATGKQQSITISGTTRLTDEEIQKMVNEAEQYAEEDKKLKEEVEVRNNSEQFVYMLEKQLSENDDKIDEDMKQDIQQSLDELKESLKGADIDNIRQKFQLLQDKSLKMGEVIYQKVAQEQEQRSTEENVVDAEVVE